MSVHIHMDHGCFCHAPCVRTLRLSVAAVGSTSDHFEFHSIVSENPVKLLVYGIQHHLLDRTWANEPFLFKGDVMHL